MSRIHYFQRYSSIENTVTNNTLLLFGRIYEHSTSAASRLLSELVGEAVYIGLEIAQQNRAGPSVPDGMLIQRSFKIAIEAKVDAYIDFDQLSRHAEGFGNEALRVLLLLTKMDLANDERKLLAQLQNRFPGIVIKHITFKDICSTIKELFKPYEQSIIELADDYVAYCNDSGLFDQSSELMRIVPCGESVGINRKYGIYFQPSDRGYTQHAFVGIYNQKSVAAIIEIMSVFDIDLDGDVLQKTLIQGKDSNAYDSAIIGLIRDAKTECDYDIDSAHRFFCGNMVVTDYKKVSSGGIQGARFVNLLDVIGPHAGVEDVASKLSNRTWD